MADKEGEKELRRTVETTKEEKSDAPKRPTTFKTEAVDELLPGGRGPRVVRPKKK